MSASMYGGLRVRVIDSSADPLTFRCSSSDPLYTFEASNDRAAEIRMMNKHGKFVAIKASDEAPDSFEFTLPPSMGDPGKLLMTDGEGKTSWTTLAAGSQTLMFPNNFSIETNNGSTTLFFGNSTNTTEGTWRIEAAENLTFHRFDGANWVSKFMLSEG